MTPPRTSSSALAIPPTPFATIPPPRQSDSCRRDAWERSRRSRHPHAGARRRSAPPRPGAARDGPAIDSRARRETCDTCCRTALPRSWCSRRPPCESSPVSRPHGRASRPGCRRARRVRRTIARGGWRRAARRNRRRWPVASNCNAESPLPARRSPASKRPAPPGRAGRSRCNTDRNRLRARRDLRRDSERHRGNAHAGRGPRPAVGALRRPGERSNEGDKVQRA